MREKLAGRCAGTSPPSSSGGRVLGAPGPRGSSPHNPAQLEVCVGSARVSGGALNAKPPRRVFVHNGRPSVGVGLGGVNACVSETRCDRRGRRYCV